MTTSRNLPQRMLLSLVIFLCTILESTQAFSDRNILLRRSLCSPFTAQRRASFCLQRSPSIRQSGQPDIALSSPVMNGPSMDKNQSWEDIMFTPVASGTQHDGITKFDKIVLGGTIAFAISSFIALLTSTAAGSWRYFMAGGICAATSHAIPTPIDVIKTRKQVDPDLADKNFLVAGREIVKAEGFNALWAGLGPTAWGYLLEGATKFGVYEVLKPLVKSSMSRLATVTSLSLLNSKLLAFVVCGTASGLAASLMLCPMEAIRIRMVAEPNFAPSGWLQAGYKILKQEGVCGLTKGVNPMITKQVPYTVTKNVSFDIITSFFYAIMRAQGKALTAGTMFTIPLVSAMIASILSTISSQPGDMLLSLVNAQEGKRSSSEFFHSIMKSERGVKGFFVGFKTRLLHVGTIVTIQLIVYDYVKRLCGIGATGTC